MTNKPETISPARAPVLHRHGLDYPEAETGDRRASDAAHAGDDGHDEREHDVSTT